MVQQRCCSPSSSPSSSPQSGGTTIAATTVSPAGAIDSACAASITSGAGSVGAAAAINSGGADSVSAAAVAAAQDSKQAALKAMMWKAKMASDNIRLLLHAKVSEQGRARPKPESRGWGALSDREDASQPTILVVIYVAIIYLVPGIYTHPVRKSKYQQVSNPTWSVTTNIRTAVSQSHTTVV